MLQITQPTGRAISLVAAAAFLSPYLAAPAPTIAATPLISPALHATVRDRRVDAHVYVGDQIGTGNLAQYPIVNGVMQTAPTATIANAYAPVALADGELYALSDNASTFLINAYSVPSLTLKRSLAVSSPGCGGILAGPPTIIATAVGPTGELFVLYACGIDGEGALYGVVVYPPRASGDQQPVQSIQIAESNDAAAWGVTVDAQNRLYVANTGLGEVQVFTHPDTNPKVARTITLPFSPYQLAIDRSAGKLYVDPFEQSTIFVYPEDAHGSPQPQREIQPAGGSGSGGLAIYGAHLFSVTGGGVDELYKRRNGSQNPIATITDSNASDVAAGP